MRIAQVATLARPCPPKGEGSVEALVSLLAEGLAARGHEVTLFAAEGSSFPEGQLRTPSGPSYRDDPAKWDWQLYEAWNAREAFAAWRDFDVIHCHSYHHGLMHCDVVPIPSAHSLHVEPGPDLQFLARRTRNRHLVFCSRWQARGFEDVPGTSVIHHGLDERALHPNAGAAHGGRLLWLGRFMPEKGPDVAIGLARRAGAGLDLAAPPNEWFEENVRPLLGGGIEHVGEVAGAGKRELLAGARALLLPLQRPEPFGLVIAEALLCGTPVIASRSGATPELVEHGVTGFLCESEDDYLAAMQRVDGLDRRRIRAIALARFSADRMVEEVESLLTGLVNGHAT